MLTFTTGDTQRPFVTSTNPASNATDAPPGSTVRILFNEDLDPATVTSTNFALDGLASSVSWDSASRTATVTPSALYAGLPVPVEPSPVHQIAGGGLVLKTEPASTVPSFAPFS